MVLLKIKEIKVLGDELINTHRFIDLVEFLYVIDEIWITDVINHNIGLRLKIDLY